MKRSTVDPREAPELSLATLGRVLATLRPYRAALLGVALLLGAMALAGLVPPLLVKALIDDAIPAGDERRVLLYAVGMLAAPLLVGLLAVGQKYLASWVAERLMLDLRVRMMESLHRQSLAYFAERPPAEPASRVLNDVAGVGGVVTQSFVDVLDALFVLVSTLALIAALDARLALLAAALLPAFVLPSRRVGLRRKRVKRDAQARAAELTGLLTETLSVSGTMLRKVFRAEAMELERFRELAAELMRLSLKQSLIGRAFKLLLALFEAAGPALVFGAGGLLVVRGELALGTVVAFVTLLKRLYGPASTLAGVRVELLVSYAYFDRIFAVLDLEPSITSPREPRPLPAPRGELRFERVSFRYAGAPAPVLHELELTISAGEHVAVVGPSGSGKSTLIALAARLYDPSEGRVLFDGMDLRELELGELLRHVAVVTQDVYLFHASVEDNLRYARPEATREELDRAAEIAQIAGTIAALPEGWSTIVGERGCRFSGGERQRLALARMILKAPRVVLLDEAMNAIDDEHKAKIRAGLEPFLRGRTTIVVAHSVEEAGPVDRVIKLG